MHSIIFKELIVNDLNSSLKFPLIFMSINLSFTLIHLSLFNAKQSSLLLNSYEILPPILNHLSFHIKSIIYHEFSLKNSHSLPKANYFLLLIPKSITI
jgi:hypothetical protein